jgi:hypothetical protein
VRSPASQSKPAGVAARAPPSDTGLLQAPLAGAARRGRRHPLGVVERQAPEQPQDRGRQRRLLGGQIGFVRQIGRLDLDAAQIAADVVGKLGDRALDAYREVGRRHLEGRRKRLGIGRAGRRQVARRRQIVAEPLLDQPQVIQRVRVPGDDASTFSNVWRASSKRHSSNSATPRSYTAAAKRGDAASAAVQAAQRLTGPPEIDQRLPLEQRQPRHPLAIAARHPAAAPARVFQAHGRTIHRRRQLVDVQISRRLQRLGIVGRQGQGQRQRVARLLQAVQAHERQRPVVVRLDRTRGLARGLLRAGERAGVVAVVEHLRRLVQQAAHRRVDPCRLFRKTSAQRTGRRLRGRRGASGARAACAATGAGAAAVTSDVTFRCFLRPAHPTASTGSKGSKSNDARFISGLSMIPRPASPPDALMRFAPRGAGADVDDQWNIQFIHGFHLTLHPMLELWSGLLRQLEHQLVVHREQ